MRLDRKLFWSYIITILIAISTSFTLFTVTSNQFLSYRLLDSMKKEMDLIQENLMVYNTGYFQPGVVIRNHIMQLVESELIIIQDNETVFYENKAILDDLQTYGVESTYFKKHYLMISGSVEVMDWKFDIILLRDKGTVVDLNRLNLNILFITSLVSMLIAAFFGVYVQNNISRPIHLLKNKIRNFQENLEAPEVTIYTGDEIQELDDR